MSFWFYFIRGTQAPLFVMMVFSVLANLLFWSSRNRAILKILADAKPQNTEAENAELYRMSVRAAARIGRRLGFSLVLSVGLLLAARAYVQATKDSLPPSLEAK